MNKCVSMGWESAVKDIARTGRSSVIDDADKSWVTYIACHKPKDVITSYSIHYTKLYDGYGRSVICYD